VDIEEERAWEAPGTMSTLSRTRTEIMLKRTRTSARMVGMTWVLGEKGVGSIKDYVDDAEDDVDVGREGHGKPQRPH